VVHSAVRYLAPLLLAVVAVVQIYRAHAFDQSPWKGGGFGMFSTVDSPGARYVRAFLVTDTGEELEVPTPTLAALAIERVRVIPEAAPLGDIAELIVQTRWVWADYDPIARLTGDGVASAGAAARDAATTAVDGLDPDALSDRLRFTRPADQPRLRPLAGGEPEPPPGALVAVDAARVELWRMTFDGDTNRLRTSRLLWAVHEVDPQTTGDVDAGRD